MKSFATNCPSCGGPVEFRISESLVTICEFCRTAVARTNKTIEDHGKVADLLQTRSPLQLGIKGRFKGKPFEITGRVQYKHPAGGVWDEWYLAFSGQMGWLAEAQGRFFLMFEKPRRILGKTPPFQDLEVGSQLDLGSQLGRVQVNEKGVATASAAEGEIPWDFTPGGDHRFADLSGPKGVVGTIEFEDAPADRDGDDTEEPAGGDAVNVYLGREMSLAEMGITAVADPDKGVQRTTAVQVNCPKCGGPLSLVAPDQTERVGCPNCKALLDNDQGNLKYLTTLKGRRVKPLIPLGSTGRVDGIEWTIIGLMERYVVEEGKRYKWTEYLLYEPAQGFRWLVNNDRHWSFVKPIATGDAERSGMTATYDGEEFNLFQKGTAHVSYVVGEFYWKVSVGENTDTRDYISPPYMLSFEGSETVRSSEMNVSLGRYITHEEVETAFGVKDLPRSWSVAPNQPAPQSRPVLGLWGLFLGILFVTFLIASAGLFRSAPDGWLFWYGLLMVSTIPVGALFYKHSFERQRWSTSNYSPYASDEE